MKRINVDTAAPAVKKFIRALSVGANGVEVALGGRVVFKIVRPEQLSEAEKSARLEDVRHLLHQAHERTKDVPAAAVERNIRDAMKAVRGGR